jgi:hypothetical protein
MIRRFQITSNFIYLADHLLFNGVASIKIPPSSVICLIGFLPFKITTAIFSFFSQIAGF